MLATSDAALKKVLRRGEEIPLTFLRFLFALPVIYLSFFFIPVPALDRTFWLVVVAGIPLEILAIVLYAKAIERSDLSLTLPMLSLTPVFLILVSWVFLKETISLQGTLGVALVAAGSYVMNISGSRKGPLYPFRVLLKDRGVQMMIAVASIYSITSTLGKIGILHSSVLFFPVLYFTGVTLTLAPLAVPRTRVSSVQVKGAALSGLFFGLMILAHMFAISMAKVAYMIALKRTSILFGSLYGFVVFKEKGIKERLTGSLIILVGVFLVSTSKT